MLLRQTKFSSGGQQGSRGAIRLRGSPRRRSSPPRSAATAASGATFSIAWLVGRSMGLVILTASVGLLYALGASPDFRVSRVDVVGAHLARASEVRAAAAVQGQHILWLRTDDIARRVERLPAVASAEVTFRLPDSVELRMRERLPVAVWASDTGQYLADYSGFLFAYRPSSDETDSLPTIWDISARPLEVGQRVDDDALLTARNLGPLLRDLPEEPSSRLEYTPDSGIELMRPGGPRVRFGGSEQLALKVNLLKSTRAHLASAGHSVELIDLRFTQRPYYR